VGRSAREGCHKLTCHARMREPAPVANAQANIATTVRMVGGREGAKSECTPSSHHTGTHKLGDFPFAGYPWVGRRGVRAMGTEVRGPHVREDSIPQRPSPPYHGHHAWY